MCFAACLTLDQGPNFSPRKAEPRSVKKLPNDPLSSSESQVPHRVAPAEATILPEELSAFLRDVAPMPGAWITRFQRELAKLRHLPAGWDSYDSPAPGAEAVALASDFLNLLWRHEDSVRPSRIAPSVDNGIVVSFLRDAVRANLEFFDSGEIAATIARYGMTPRVWEVENAEDAIERAIDDIRDEIET